MTQLHPTVKKATRASTVEVILPPGKKISLEVTYDSSSDESSELEIMESKDWVRLTEIPEWCEGDFDCSPALDIIIEPNSPRRRPVRKHRAPKALIITLIDTNAEVGL